ncbi:hypothetical protein T05_7151 [Trichinella murrelli]|uniref:Uncharacterized protein n=1 Tax=Trichinella murrelli TaxID=144512 RepID=A0A0V0U8I5_9BILA|nr:hypothetical protein T05_7151 [Trichinella murrelli]
MFCLNVAENVLANECFNKLHISRHSNLLKTGDGSQLQSTKVKQSSIDKPTPELATLKVLAEFYKGILCLENGIDDIEQIADIYYVFGKDIMVDDKQM